MSWYQRQGDRLLLNLYVQPRGSKDEVQGVVGEELKLKIKAPPVDGKANAYLLQLLAQWFGVSKSRVSLLQGQSSRHKRVEIIAPQSFPEFFHQYD